MLIGNYNVFSKHPGRDRGGGATGLGCNQNDFNKISPSRGCFSHTNWSKQSGRPYGYRPPYSWILSQTSGALVTHYRVLGAATLTGGGAMGKNATVTITSTGRIYPLAPLGIVITAVFSGLGRLYPAPELTAVGELGTTAIPVVITTSSELAGSLVADGWLIGTVAGAGEVADAEPRADGYMDATVSNPVSAEISQIAQAVWSALAESLEEPGTVGERLALIEAVLRNRTITDPVAGTITVYNDTDSGVLLEADIFEDADGNTPYSGNGVNRRERLV
jgi:hypothetical protein